MYISLIVMCIRALKRLKPNYTMDNYTKIVPYFSITASVFICMPNSHFFMNGLDIIFMIFIV